MADCGHKWKLRANGLKEDCELCGAARIYDSNQCDHEWVIKPDIGKERCVKCGAARVVLNVHDLKQHQAAKITEG